MSKTIKVKELLNMENLPENIKINGTSFERTEFNMLEALYANNNNRWWTNCAEILLDNEVEIIEEQEEIDKLEIDDNGFIHTNNGTWKGRKLDVAFAEVINKLADEVKNIKEK